VEAQLADLAARTTLQAQEDLAQQTHQVRQDEGGCKVTIFTESRFASRCSLELSSIRTSSDITTRKHTNMHPGGGLFGQSKPAAGGFGSTTAAPSGGGLFGGSSTGGGFGANNSTTQSNPFGGSAAPASNPFGGGAASTGGFGATNNTANAGSGFAFGGGNAPAAGGATQGTAATPFQPFTEKDGAGSSSTSSYQSITMQPQYQAKSFEELRVEDYMQNRKLPQSGSFGGATGASSTFGGFGQNNAAAAAPAQTGGGLFGGANTNTAGGFGASNTASTGFGANTNTSTGFGASNTGGGLFGAAKPATGGLFGNNAASTGTATGGFGATAGSGGGLFGNSQPQANTGTGFGGGFGAGAANTNTTGGGLFGAQNNQTQNKPAFGGFGASNTATTGGFGQTNNTVQQPQQGGGLFGGGNAAANTGTSLFGGQQNKPAGGGLFGAANTGAANTGGGLFGNANNTNNQQQGTGFGQSTGNTGGGLFGATNNQNNNAGGSLFGNSQAKPATGGLFGASTTGTNTGGGLFGNNNQQQQGANAGGSLFGGNNNNQQQQNAGGSLFGGQQNKPAGGGLFGGSTGGGGSLFGNTQTQNQGGLFGGNNANQGAGNSLFGGNQSQNQGAGSSLFGGSQQQQQQNQLTATLTGDPYGNAQLFSSLAAPSPPVGPLATPLSGAKAPQRPRTSLLSSVRGGAPMLGASQNMTPRTRPGYGFSYSTYNSPASGSQNLTPGAAGLLRPTGSLGSSLSGRLSKSFSTSNLRGEAPEGQSLLRTPAAGQSSLLLGNGNGSFGTGSARKLKIDRNLRTDLFGDNTPKQKQIEATKDQDPALRKRVSFDRTAEDNAAKPTAANSLVVREDEDTTPTGSPEPKQVNGNGLDSVPEESTTPKASAAASPMSKKIIDGGDYWTSPSIKQLQNMSRQQLQKISIFTVGRHNLGQVEFGRDGGVDLSTVPLERICGELVKLEYRHCTVYGDDQEKPPMGEGLNVPSTIHLEQSWPRSSRASSATPQGKAAAAKQIEKHRRGLANVKDTEFVDYDANTGIWTFNVEHFTTYGFDESDDEDDFEDGTDMMDLQPRIPASMRDASNGHPEATKSQRSEESEDSDMDSPDLGEPEDTFEFKLSRRSHQGDLTVPGGFEDVDSKSRSTFEHDNARTNELHQDEHIMSGGLGDSYMDDPFIEAGGAVQAPNSGTFQKYNSSEMDDEESDQEVPGSFRAEPLPPRSILKPSAHMRSFASPEKVAELPWEEQLQRTMSPKKRDRQALRDMQGSLAHVQRESMESPLKKSLFSHSQLGQSHLAVKSAKKNATGFGASTLGRDQDFGKSQAFTTGMDLINSLWGQAPKEPKAKDATAEV
jgi:nuclear pore complex protein Nup98-Nup96